MGIEAMKTAMKTHKESKTKKHQQKTMILYGKELG